MERIWKVLERLGVVFAAVASINGERIEEYGDPGKLPTDDIYRQFFRDGVAALDQALKDRPLPRTARQGSVGCAIWKPTPDLIVAAFSHDARDGVATVQWARELARAVKAAVDDRGT